MNSRFYPVYFFRHSSFPASDWLRTLFDNLLQLMTGWKSEFIKAKSLSNTKARDAWSVCSGRTKLELWYMR